MTVDRPLRKGLFGTVPLGAAPRSLNAPGSFDPGTAAVPVTLDRAILRTELELATDLHWSNPEVWKEVIVTYRDAGGEQRRRMIFRVDNTSSFQVSQYAHQNIWTIESIALYDHDGAVKVFYAGQIPFPSELDINVQDAPAGA